MKECATHESILGPLAYEADMLQTELPHPVFCHLMQTKITLKMLKAYKAWIPLNNLYHISVERSPFTRMCQRITVNTN